MGGGADSLKDDRDRIIERIKKCLRKADSTRNTSVEEVEVAVAMAQKLMNEYNIKQSEVILDADDKLNEPVGEFDIGGKWHTYTKWKVRLTQVVKILCSVECYYKHIDYSPVCSLIFVGLDGDCKLAAALYRVLLKTVDRMIKDFDGHKASYGRGVVDRLVTRAKEESHKTSQSSTATTKYGLMVIAKDVEIKAVLKSKGVCSKPARNYRADADSFDRGWEDGGRIDLGTKNRLS
jgi:hypothetical protein